MKAPSDVLNQERILNLAIGNERKYDIENLSNILKLSSRINLDMFSPGDHDVFPTQYVLKKCNKH